MNFHGNGLPKGCNTGTICGADPMNMRRDSFVTGLLRALNKGKAEGEEVTLPVAANSSHRLYQRAEEISIRTQQF